MRRRVRPGKPELLKFGNYIRSLRQKRGLYLEHVASGTGFSINYISEVERGITSPNDELVSALADFFNEQEEVLYFMAGKVPPSFVEEVLKYEELQDFVIQISRSRNLPEEKKKEYYGMINDILKVHV